MRRLGSSAEDRTANRKTGRKAKGKGNTLGQEAGRKDSVQLPFSVPLTSKLIQTELFGSGKSSFFLRPN